ncbi:MAG TPA: hypothetical protein VFA28_05560 [Bryobacteraceae bacterium]|jgi:hypothetical protein|nr:hypothetical protein [Bryobacteraceae bacterium]
MRWGLFAAAVALSGAAQAHDVISTKITWSREVSRIIYSRCVSCHHEGGTAFSLMTYQDSRPWAKAIKEEVLARRMPPWNAVKGFGEFRDDQGLTQEQIEVIADWVEGGAPEGDPALLPPVPNLTAPKSLRPQAPALVVKGSLTLKSASELVAIEPGPLAPGARLQVIAVRPDGVIEPLLWVEKFNADYNGIYHFKRPLRLPPGARIEVTPGTGSVTIYGGPATG